MTRVFNFAAGPGILPLPVLEEVAANLVDYHGQGMSLLEMSHRGAIFSQIIRETKDLLRELLDGTTISKYNPQKRATFPLLRAEGCKSNNGTKATPCLAADMAGDWREEVLLRTETDDALRLYVTPHSTPYRFVTFLQDPVYRLSVATQNVGYNQPSEPGFYFGPDASPQQ